MLAPIAWRTPPRAYGPWELVTSLLTEALVARGIDVTLFATQDSFTKGTLAGVVPRPYSEEPAIDAKVWELRHLSYLFERAGEFDVIHNQADFPAHAFARLVDTPVVTTIHGFSSDRILPMYEPFQDVVRFVAISEADRHPALRYAATIHHGIPLDDFAFDSAGTDDLLFFGRIHPDKGAADAIAAAQATGKRLRMAGIVQDQDYHEREVAPHIDGDRITYLGAVGGDERVRTLGAAARAVAPHPFRRAVRPIGDRGDGVRDAGDRVQPRLDAELIEHGVTGFLVDTLDEAVAAIARLGTIDRASCRARVAARFTVDRMADRYVALYRRSSGGEAGGSRGWRSGLAVLRDAASAALSSSSGRTAVGWGDGGSAAPPPPSSNPSPAAADPGGDGGAEAVASSLRTAMVDLARTTPPLVTPARYLAA